MDHSLHWFFAHLVYSLLTLFVTAEGLDLHQPKGSTTSSTGKCPRYQQCAELVLFPAIEVTFKRGRRSQQLISGRPEDLYHKVTMSLGHESAHTHALSLTSLRIR
jgi:hypothetical protein